VIRRKPKKNKWEKKTVPNRNLAPKDGKAAPTIQIKLTKEFKHAFDQIENTNHHIFLTGRAGTGKSTLLKYFRAKTKKRFIVLAPTGVAALNVKGQTIHSFFGFHPKITKRLVRKAQADKLKAFKELETIVIDEISMVRADLLDCMDRALRLNREKPHEPFGGVQMIFIGDLYQLPPVVTREEGDRFQTEYPSPYFFSAECMVLTPIEIIELEFVHRQKDPKFVALLNAIRSGSITAEQAEQWDGCHDPFFDPTDESEQIVHLTTTNKAADARNAHELNKLESTEHTLKASKQGELPNRKMPSDPSIKVKEGARIMFTVNDPAKRWVNGSLGVIKKIQTSGLSKAPVLSVELDTGERVEVGKHTWEVFDYQYNGARFAEAVLGSYSQYPISLAWAVTIHKAQGKTFDQVLVDMGWGAFAHGQLYVALSRCTTMKGIKLLKPFRMKDVIVDQAVLDFMKNE
jgi:ATP-dependent DNA helicase PIF1